MYASMSNEGKLFPFVNMVEKHGSITIHFKIRLMVTYIFTDLNDSKDVRVVSQWPPNVSYNRSTRQLSSSSACR